MLIRRVVPSDAGRVVELLAAGSLTGEAADPSDLAAVAETIADLTGTAGAVLVAEVDDVVVGVCQLLIFRHLQHRGGWCAELESVHIDPRHRGRGIGGRLVEDAVAMAAEAGCYRVQLTSNKARPDAHRFYQRHGFVASHEGFKRMLA